MIVANRIDEVDLDAHAARIRRQDRVATGILTAIVAFVLALLAAIVAFIVFQGIGKALSPGFLTTPPAADVNPGISSELFDSFYMLAITLLISVPISLGAAIFLAEYAPDNWVTKAASTAIETLSSLPSIVVGMFGSLFFVVTMGWGISILAGAMALTMFNIPILVRVIQQALEDVPRSQHHAALEGHGPHALGDHYPRASPRRHARHCDWHRDLCRPRLR